jgi:hypothetical protein
MDSDHKLADVRTRGVTRNELRAIIARMSGEQHIQSMIRRGVLTPMVIGFVLFGVGLLIVRHWLSAIVLLAGALVAVLSGPRIVHRNKDVFELMAQSGGQSFDDRATPEARDLGELSIAAGKMDILLFFVLLGVTWAEHLGFVHSAAIIVIACGAYPLLSITSIMVASGH